MKKQSLLGAAALSTVAFAGVANAQELTPVAAGASTVGEYRVIATESKLTSTQRTGVIGLSYKVGAGTPSALSKLTVALSEGAVFSKAFSITQLNDDVDNECAPTISLSTGGAAGTSAATFLVEGLNKCVDDALIFNVPVTLAATPASFNIATSLTTEAGTKIAAGTATTQTETADLISFDSAVKINIAADDVATQATIDSDFQKLATVGDFDNIIGTATVAVDTSKYLGIDSAAKIASTNFSNTAFTVVGDLENVVVAVNGEVVEEGEATPNEGTAIIAPVAANYTVTVTETGEDNSIPGGSYQGRIRLNVPASGAVVNSVATGLVSLQSVTREGAQYLIPWVASRTLAQTSTSNTVIRIANIGSSAVGRVSAELLTSSNGVTTSTLVPLASSITPRGELVITSNSLQNAIGSDFGRADIRITVEGAPANLVVRRFVQSTVNGALSEVSLGRGNGADVGSEPVN